MEIIEAEAIWDEYRTGRLVFGDSRQSAMSTALLIRFSRSRRCRRDFTPTRIARRGNFSGLLLNVAGRNIGYFSDKVNRTLIE